MFVGKMIPPRREVSMSNKLTARGLGGLSLSLILTVALSGCEQLSENSGDVSVSRDGDAVRVAFCDPIEVDRIVIDTAHRGLVLNGFVDTVYIAKGRASFPEGFVLSTATDVENLSVEVRLDPRLDEANSVSVAARTIEPEDFISVDFNFSTGGLPTDSWLRSDGSTSEEPC